MKLLVPAILALASTAPATDAWSMLGGTNCTKQIHHTNPAFALASRFLDHQGTTSPRYELVDNDQQFQLSVHLPGFKMEDIDVSLEDGHLTVSGQRLASTNHSRFASKFFQSFSLDPSVDVEQLTANLDHGVLVVSAPKNMTRIEDNVFKIPIVQGKIPLEEVSASSSVDDSPAEPLDLGKAEASA